MAGMKWRRRVAAMVMVVASLAAGGLSSVSSASAAADPVITWPAVTRFNPGAIDYLVGVSGLEPPARVRLRDDWGSPEVWVDADGEYNYEPSDRATRIYASLCVDGSCRLLSTSPVLDLHSRIELWPEAILGPNRPFFSVVPVEVPYDISWQVLPVDGGVALAAGSAVQVTSSPRVGDQPALVNGETYRLQATVVIDGPNWGHMERTYDGTFQWDTRPPGSKLKLWVSPDRHDVAADDTIFPADDRFAERMDIVFSHPIPAYSDFVITSASDAVVFARRGSPQTSNFRAVWRGRDSSGAILPEGEYLLTATAYDAVGNGAVTTRTLHVDHRERVTRRWRTSISPTGSMIGRSVGRCASLRRPARDGWPGSQGYRSRVCRPFAETIVSTNHGIYVPQSPTGDYGPVRVSVHGGKALGERTATLLLFYWKTKGEWSDANRIEGRLGKHPARQLDGPFVIHDTRPGQRPHLIWSVGLAGGHKYDVKRFTVDMEYDDLVDP